jgi:hypothetical protein
MKPLLSKSILDRMNRTLYPAGAKATFYKVTPTDGEVEIGSITSGFLINREQRAAGRDGTGVNMRLSADAAIAQSALHVGAEVALTIDGQTRRYSLVELLPMQQLGSGYTLRLLPLEGATG